MRFPLTPSHAQHSNKHPLLMTALVSALCLGTLSACNANSSPASTTSATSANDQKNAQTTDSNAATSAATTPVSSDSDPQVVAALQQNLTASGIKETITSAVPTEMPGIYWVTAEGLPAFFTDKDGKHIIQGQIVRVGTPEPVDITAQLQAQAAKEKLAQVAKKDMIIYPAKGETKGVVYAFTDVDCGYCRKLHEEMADINARGIEVRYLAWPRSEEIKPKMEAVWCSSDRNAAMDTAKRGGNVTAAPCTNPVEAQMALGMSLGVRGTPAIFTVDGHQIGGYLPADALVKAATTSTK